MNATANLNTYSIRYRTFTAKGTLDVLVQNKKIDADSELSAIDILKSKQKDAGSAEIRIDAIEKINAAEATKKEKKKKSPIVWIFFILLGLASLGRLASKLF